MKTLLVIDSTFYMSKEKIDEMNIKVIPLTVHLDNITYTEKYDDGKGNDELFETIFDRKSLATTSQPSTEIAMDVYQSAIDEGYEKIISLHISSGLSGTAQGMRVAANTVLENNKDKNVQIEVFDTQLVAQAATIVADEVYGIIQKDGSIEVQEVQKIIDFYKDNIKIFFTVESMDFLVFGGRIKPAVASVLNVFGITPMLTIKDGEIEKYSVARSKKAVYSKILTELKKENFTKDDNVIIAGAYSTSDKDVQKIIKNLLKEIDSNIVHNEVSSLGLIIANHLGPKGYGVGWSRKYKRDN